MIRILHYCWFGGNPLPPSAIEYMKGWEKCCPDFYIKRWDESNFDINSVPFVEQAYRSKNWAFVSDYVRTYALYEEGGLYADTDVEFIRPMDDLMSGSFIGFETHDIVNPGLILYAAYPKLSFYGKVLSIYNNLNFNEEIKSSITSPKIYTSVLEEMGLIGDNTLQHLNEITVYPMEYFQPWGEDWRKKKITENTRSIHHYDASWLDKIEKEYYYLRKSHGEFLGRLLFSIRHPVSAFKKFKK